MAGLNSLVIAVLVGIDAWHRHAAAPAHAAAPVTLGGWAFAGAFVVQVVVSLVLGERDRAARKQRDEARKGIFGAAGS